LTILLALLLSPRWASPIWRRARILYWQRQCLNYELARGTVVYQTNSTNTQVVRSVVAQPWRSLYFLLSPPGFRSYGTAFLHERISPSGHHRLIAIDINFPGGSQPPPPDLDYTAREFSPGSFLHDPCELPSGPFLYCNLPTNQPVQFFAGVADPIDPSHFTLEFRARSERRVVDGWLKDDDRVVLELRDATAKNK
jgi:hypothetical protein